MKHNLKRFLAITAFLIIVLGTFSSFAASYTYSIDGMAQASPDAYRTQVVVDSAMMGLETALKNPTDIETDDDGNVYIADPENDRIVVLDEYYKLKFQISTFNNDLGGGADSLMRPTGLFVWEGLEADEEGNFHRQK